MIEYKLIDSTTKDFEFLKTTHHITLKKYVAPIWGWDEQSQDKMFLKKFDPSIKINNRLSKKELNFINFIKLKNTINKLYI